MNFKDIAEYVGVTSFPEEFEEIYKRINAVETIFCDLSYFKKYEDEYGILGEYYTVATDAIEKIKKDEKLFIYGKIYCEYAKTATTTEVRCTPMPKLDTSAERDYFALGVMYSIFPSAIETLKDRGFSEEDIKNAFKEVYKAIESSKKQLGRPAMMDVYYNWSMLYVYGEIFPCGGFTFQLKQFPHEVILLQNKVTEEYIPVMTVGIFNKDGLVLGSAGAEDEEGSFGAEFEETEDAYLCRKVQNGRVLREKAEYKKSEWDCILKNGDYVLAVHIPRNTDVTHEAVKRDFNMALDRAKQVFPKHDLHRLICCSWLLDPTLEKLMGENSRVVGFGKEFVRFPVNSHGEEHKLFVFPGFNGALSDLPEETSMQRKIKALLLSGGHIYAVAGVYAEK